MYRTIIKRAGNNPLTNKKQYRVFKSFCVDSFIEYIDLKPQYEYGFLHITVNKRYQVGTFINPRKALGI